MRKSARLPDHVDLTSATDGRTHTVTSAEFDSGAQEGTGHYRAVCGADVLAAALVCAPGPRCPACRHQHDRLDDVPDPRFLVRLLRRRRGV